MSFGKLGQSFGRLGSLGGAGSVPGFLNFTGSNLSNFATARAATLAGTANSKIVPWGDSTVAGVWANGSAGGNNAQAFSWPTKLASLLSASSWQSIWGDRNIVASLSAPINGFDNRQQVVSPWVGGPNFGFAGPLYQGQAVGGGYSFTPTTPVDTAEIWTVFNTSNGVLGVSVDGGAVTNFAVNASNKVDKITISVPLGAHTFNVSYVSGAQVFVVGILAYNSAAKETSILNAGWSSALAANLSDVSNYYGSLNALVAIKPHLTIIEGGIANDQNLATNLTTFQTQIQSMITALKAAGSDVILMSNAPQTRVSNAAQLPYINVYKALALSNNIPMIDVFALFGSTFNAPLMADSVHLNAAGYATVAGYVNRALAPSFRAR